MNLYTFKILCRAQSRFCVLCLACYRNDKTIINNSLNGLLKLKVFLMNVDYDINGTVIDMLIKTTFNFRVNLK